MNAWETGGTMGGLLGAARDAMFAVDGGTGAKLTRSLDQTIDAVDRAISGATARLDRPLPLGDLPEAKTFSDMHRLVAVGDEQSLVHVLGLFKVSLEQAKEAVRLGMANYDKVETEIAESYNKIHPGFGSTSGSGAV